MQSAREKGKWAGMKGGLRPTAVTRDLSWGVPVPGVDDAEEDEAMKGKVMCEFLTVPLFSKLTQCIC
jgi:methionyl-tRNA synthetase